ncbi:MAG: CpsD/CapB family tyrosine-protein kinase [Anaerolineae bacterium]|jgi:non-specific protein-tyrosine kinase|nr:CpsD/CapB family tyrosine-protein kinase [Anaerolineae bacterium]
MDVNLVTLRDPRSPAAEAYRALRMNLAFTSLDRDLTCFVVAPPGAEGLDANVAANLAVVMAQSGKQVCLVDADLRRPTLHTLFGVAQEPGVTTLLVSPEDDFATQLADTGVPGLLLLPSGALPPNPADILGSNKMAALLDRLQGMADVVIFQAPPVTVAVDAAVLAAQTDGLLLVVRTGHTRRDRVEQAKELLERFRVRLLGAVMTDAPDRGLLTGY